MIQEFQLGQDPEATYPSMDHFPTLKIDFKKFSGEPEDWNTWSTVHDAQVSVLSVEGCEVKIGAGGFEDSEF